MLLFLRIEQRLGSYSRTSMKCSLKVDLHVTIPLFIFVILCIILMLHNATSNTVPCLEILFCYDKFSTLIQIRKTYITNIVCALMLYHTTGYSCETLQIRGKELFSHTIWNMGLNGI